MNPFVDPNKRSVSLPPGCKDLIDVLRSQSGVESADDLVIKPERFEGVGLGDVLRYVTKVVASSAKMATLHIKSSDGTSAVALVRSASEFSMNPAMGTLQREKEVEKFFAGRGVESIADFFVGHPGMATRVLAFPLPPTASDATVLTVDLLREVYDLNDESEAEFVFVECSGV